MAYQIKNTGSPSHRKLDLLSHGLAGTEKTLSIGRFANAGFAPLVIACDPGGTVTLKSFNIPYIEVDKPGTLYEIIKDIHSGKLDLRQYGMICVDGLTNLSYMCLKATGESANDRRLDYANYWIGFRRLVDELRRLPLHFYANCLSAEIKQDANKWGPYIEGGKFCIQLAGMFNAVIAHRRIQDGSKDNFGNPLAPVYLQTLDDGFFNCKERTNSCNMFERDLSEIAIKILNNPNA